MSQPNAQSGNHDNPYGAYTQDHQNWSNQAEQMRKSAQQERDFARTQQQEESNRQEAARQREAQMRQSQQEARAHKESQLAKKASQVKTQPRHQPRSQPKPQPQSAPWSNGWALIGMIAAVAFTYPRVNGMDEKWWAIGFAAVVVGALAGRFYKVIVFFIGLAVVLAIGAVALSVWANWDQGANLSLVPNGGSSWDTYAVAQNNE